MVDSNLGPWTSHMPHTLASVQAISELFSFRKNAFAYSMLCSDGNLFYGVWTVDSVAADNVAYVCFAAVS